jgi:hypothetical protein
VSKVWRVIAMVVVIALWWYPLMRYWRWKRRRMVQWTTDRQQARRDKTPK